MVDTNQIDHTVFNGNVDYYACPVMHHETLFGFICILANCKPLSKYDLTLLHKISNFVALVCKKMPDDAGDGVFREIIKDILDDKIQDENELEVRMLSRNWHTTHTYQLVAIDIGNVSQKYTKYILDGIESISRNIKRLVYHNHVIVLIEHSYRKQDILDYIERFRFCAGVSDTFDNLLAIKVQFAKAKQAIHIGQILGHQQNIFNYATYRFEDMLYAFHSNVHCECYYHPIVEELELYDKKNKTAFCPTLLEYLEHGNSINKASSLLHLHKNTVNYRIQRIKELFEVDFTHHNETNHIFLSLKIKALKDTIHAR